MTDTAAPAAALAARSPRRRWPWAVAACCVTVAVAVAITAVWFVGWRSRLRPLTTYPTYGFQTSVDVGQTEYFGANTVDRRFFTTFHPDRLQLTLTIDDVTPVVTENTADADITLFTCVLAYRGADTAGYRRAEINTACSQLTPFTSGPVTIGVQRGDDDIIVAITPHHAGKVRVNGLRVRLSSGLQHGMQHIGGQLGTNTGGE